MVLTQAPAGHGRLGRFPAAFGGGPPTAPVGIMKVSGPEHPGTDERVLLNIVHLARWFAWQIREPETVVGQREARITVISGGR